MSRISTATARRLFWGLLFAVPSACLVLLAILTGTWMWLAAVPVVFLVVGGPGEHLFRALLRGADVSAADGDKTRRGG